MVVLLLCAAVACDKNESGAGIPAGKEEITVVQTRRDYPKRWEFAWATAGETGDRIGRGVIIDDGNYHYCLSTLLDVDAPESQIVWSEVFNSFELS